MPQASKSSKEQVADGSTSNKIHCVQGLSTLPKIRPGGENAAGSRNANDGISAPREVVSPVEGLTSSKDLDFEIDNETFARCLPLLLDKSVITSHYSCHFNNFDQHIPRKILVTAICRTFKSFKEKNKVHENSAVKYSSILSEELHGRRERYSQVAFRRNFNGFYVLKSSQTMTLDMQKPDRNKKHFNFVLCSALLQAHPDGICAAELFKMAKQGLETSGCAENPGKSCGGPSACLENAELPECKFFNESKLEIGKGAVHVCPSYIAGKKICSDSVLVNFTKITTSNSFTGFKPWKLEQISRYYLLDPFESVFGSAMRAVANLHTGGSGNSLAKTLMDISSAAVVCDIHIEKNKLSSM